MYSLHALIYVQTIEVFIQLEWSLSALAMEVMPKSFGFRVHLESLASAFGISVSRFMSSIVNTLCLPFMVCCSQFVVDWKINTVCCQFETNVFGSKPDLNNEEIYTFGIETHY